MSNLLKHLKTYQAESADRILPRMAQYTPYAEDSCVPTGEDDGRCASFRLSAELGVLFWANPAQYSYARKTAQRQLVRAFYGDVLRAIDDVHAMLYAGDLEMAHMRLDALRKELEGE